MQPLSVMTMLLGASFVFGAAIEGTPGTDLTRRSPDYGKTFSRYVQSHLELRLLINYRARKSYVGIVKKRAGEDIRLTCYREPYSTTESLQSLHCRRDRNSLLSISGCWILSSTFSITGWFGTRWTKVSGLYCEESRDVYQPRIWLLLS